MQPNVLTFILSKISVFYHTVHNRGSKRRSHASFCMRYIYMRPFYMYPIKKTCSHCSKVRTVYPKRTLPERLVGKELAVVLIWISVLRKSNHCVFRCTKPSLFHVKCFLRNFARNLARVLETCMLKVISISSMRFPVHKTIMMCYVVHSETDTPDVSVKFAGKLALHSSLHHRVYEDVYDDEVLTSLFS